MAKSLKTTSQKRALAISGCVSHQTAGRAMLSQCHLQGFLLPQGPICHLERATPPCLSTATSPQRSLFPRAPAGQDWALCSVSARQGGRSPLCRLARAPCRALEQGNPSCGFPTFLVAPAPQPKQNQHFPFFFFYSLFSLRPSRRRGCPTARSQSCTGWKAAIPSQFPTSSRVPAAPSPQQPLGEQGTWGDTVG